MTILDEIRADSARAAARFDAFNDRFEALNDRFTVLERTMNDRFATLEVKVADAKADLMKWSFLFWCGAVASIAALAGVLR